MPVFSGIAIGVAASTAATVPWLRRSEAGKLFAAGYALFGGIAFISTPGLLVAPFAHRMLHSLHVERAGGDAK
jgi:hypothetical protein